MNVQSVNNNLSFRGLWAKDYTLDRSESWYGGELDVNYYSKSYYPFADETEKEIASQVNSASDEYTQKDYMDIPVHVDYYRGKAKSPLRITKQDYDTLISKRFAPLLNLSKEDYKDLKNQKINEHLLEIFC